MAEGPARLPSEFVCGKCQTLQEIEFEYFDVECCRVCFACLKMQALCPVCGRELAPEEQEMIAIYNEAYFSTDSLPAENLQA